MKSERKYHPISGYKFPSPFHDSKIFSIGVHWVFQNMINTDSTELIFKLTFYLLLTILFAILFTNWVHDLLAIAAGFFMAHSINFLFNGQIFVVLKFFGDVRHEPSEIEAYIKGIQTRLQREPSIRWAAIYGSLARGELKPTSDLDVRFIRFPDLGTD
jgi:hypothetical protein